MDTGILQVHRISAIELKFIGFGFTIDYIQQTDQMKMGV